MTSLLLCGSVNAVDKAGPSTVAIEKKTTDAGDTLATLALKFLGVNYRFGGNSPDTGLDCSGLVRLVFREAAGMILPRRSEEISRAGVRVETHALQPGDLVFFNTLRQAFSHVGIYIGNNQFVHAPSTGGRVRVESIQTRYWRTRFDGARRLIDPEASITAVRVAQPNARLAAVRSVTNSAQGPSSAWRDTRRWANQGVVSRSHQDTEVQRNQKDFDQLLELLNPHPSESGPLGANANLSEPTKPSQTPTSVTSPGQSSSMSSQVNPIGRSHLPRRQRVTSARR